MNRFHQRLLVLLFIAAAGCGSNSDTPPATSAGGELSTVGGNSRLKYKEDYKKMLGKDGKMLWNPSTTTKRPPGIPKS